MLANVEAGPSSQCLLSIEWDVQLNPSGPTFELLYGGSLSPSKSHDACCVALIWHSKLSHAEGTALVANHHLVFTCQALTEVLGRCYTTSPSAGGSQSGPSSSSGDKGKGKGRTNNEVIGKGKSCADPPAEPMDEDGEDNADNGEDAAGDSDGADAPAWGGF